MVRAHTIGKAVRGRLCAPESPIWGACTRLLKCAGGDRQDYGIRPVAGNRPAVPNLKKIAPVGSIGGDLPRKGRRSGESHRSPLNRRVVTIAVRQVGRSLGRFVQRSGVVESTAINVDFSIAPLPLSCHNLNNRWDGTLFIYVENYQPNVHSVMSSDTKTIQRILK